MFFFCEYPLLLIWLGPMNGLHPDRLIFNLDSIVRCVSRYKLSLGFNFGRKLAPSPSPQGWKRFFPCLHSSQPLFYCRWYLIGPAGQGEEVHRFVFSRILLWPL
ncbi:unnamed protein product, partial [Ectocarpus sp. 8 AP-2014]